MMIMIAVNLLAAIAFFYIIRHREINLTKNNNIYMDGDGMIVDKIKYISLIAIVVFVSFVMLFVVAYNQDINIYNNHTSINQSQSQEIKININTATKKELISLPMIGEGLADNIIKYREYNKFDDISEILNVDRIGEKTYNVIKGEIKVE